MDLLKYLIVPGTEAYARWASSAFRRPDSHTPHSSVLDGRRDSVQENGKRLPLPERDDVNGSSNDDLEDGEIVEAICTKQLQTQAISTQNQDRIRADKAEPSRNARPQVQKRSAGRRNRLCFFWYHYRHCDRDPANSTNTNKPCPYIHSLEGVQSNASVSHFRRWMHKGPCGLELCPFKNTEWKPKPEPRGREKQAHERESTVFDNKTGSRLMAPPKNTNNLNPEKKRKASRPHPDTPLSSGCKRQKLSYDDEATRPGRQNHEYPGAVKRQKLSHDNHSATEPERNSDGEETCFFWYHGNCARSQERRRNFQCPFRHGLTDPPTMVKPPPGYVHRMPCELDLCPGDASKNESHGDKRYFEGTMKRMGGDQTSRAKVDKEQDWYLSGFDDC